MLFVSRAKNLRVILKPQDRMIDSHGRPIMTRGITAEFGGGRFSTDDKEVIGMLLSHPLKNFEYVCADLVDEKKWVADHPSGDSKIEMVTGTRAITKRDVPPVEPPTISAIDIEKLISDRVDEKLKDMFKILDNIKLPEEEIPKEMKEKQSTSNNVLMT
jgi:hypothetical protein